MVKRGPLLRHIENGNVHEPDCDWLQTKLDKDPDDRVKYEEVSRSDPRIWRNNLCSDCWPQVPVVRR